VNSNIWLLKPANEWCEGLPVGNGKLAGMIMGGVLGEHMCLNHEWLGCYAGEDWLAGPNGADMPHIKS